MNGHKAFSIFFQIGFPGIDNLQESTPFNINRTIFCLDKLIFFHDFVFEKTVIWALTD